MDSLGNGFDTSSLFASSTAETDKMRQESEAANTLSLDNLTDSINKLSDKFDNGMINIPDNATFNVPVNIDGQTVANVTAPYLDVINGEKMDLESMGVTSR
jgi:phage-related protein